MPGREINLLPEQDFIDKEKEKVRQKSIFRFTVLATFLTALVILGAFIYSYYLNNQSAQIKKRINVEMQKIERLRKKEILLLVIKTKLQAIQKVLSTKPLYETQLKAIDLIFSLLTDQLILSDYLVEGKNFEFTLTASDSTVVEEFIDQLIAENNRDPLFTSILLKSVELDKNGDYKLHLIMDFASISSK